MSSSSKTHLFREYFFLHPFWPFPKVGKCPLRGPEASLTTVERNLASRFAVTDVEVAQEEVVDFAHRIENNMKRRRVSLKLRYKDINWIPPTSNIVERLFSRAKLNLTDLRSRMEPRTFEALLYLHCNESLWDQSLLSALCALEVHKGTDAEDNTL